MTLRYAMKDATHTPNITSASSTLTAARIPSSRLVVPSSPDMCVTSERGRLAARIPRRRIPAFAQRVLQQLPAFVGGSCRLLDRVPEADELAREVFERRLDLPPHAPPTLCEEQVPSDPTDDGAHDRGCHFPRVVHQSSYHPNCQVIGGMGTGVVR